MGKIIGKISKPFKGIFGDELGTALMMAGLTAATVFTGGAAAGAFAGTGALAGGVGAATSGAGLAAAGTAAAQGAQSAHQLNQQEKAQANAAADARRALNEQEMTRKRAMLAEQTSLSARNNAARNIRNNLYGLSQTTKLGSTDEQLGA